MVLANIWNPKRFFLLAKISQVFDHCSPGYFTSGKMNVCLKWVIYVEEM